MAITRLNNNSVTSVSALPSLASLPSGIDTGKINQVVNATYSTITGNSSTTHADTGLTASITPSATSSKVFILAMLSCYITRASAETYMNLDIVRDSTIIYEQGSQNFGGYIGNSNYYQDSKTQTITFLDSPNTTSSTTYKITFAQQGGGTATVQVQSTPSAIILMEVLA